MLLGKLLLQVLNFLLLCQYLLLHLLLLSVHSCLNLLYSYSYVLWNSLLLFLIHRKLCLTDRFRTLLLSRSDQAKRTHHNCKYRQ